MLFLAYNETVCLHVSKCMLFFTYIEGVGLLVSTMYTVFDIH